MGMNIVRHKTYKATGKRMRQVAGVVVHDTVTPDLWPSAKHADFLAPGVRQAGGKFIPPPLYHYVIGRDGTIYQMASETVKANHAGRGCSAQLARLRAPAVKFSVPEPQNNRCRNGNYYLLGVTLARSGANTVPAPQMAALTDLLRDIIRRHPGVTAERVLGHKEWTNRKIDPNRVNLDELRYRLLEPTAYQEQPAPTEPPTIRRGHRSEWVAVLQRRLLECGLIRARDVIGRFGPRTERAVKTYQLCHRLKADGVVGAATWKVIMPLNKRRK